MIRHEYSQCHFCGSTTFDGMPHNCQSKTITGRIDMQSLTLMKPKEPCVLIPLTLLMDLYALAFSSGKSTMVEGIKKAILGEE